ncbi:antitoxin VbhA family protein [Stenotrophomonas bentonitica]|uniref:antitoxin VbhA family protein n=1 Tax=Stenotrophomonas bentonitica TaxID=1450134 RepID=UPI00345EB2FD
MNRRHSDPLDAAEIARRAEAVKFAAVSCALEGLFPSDAAMEKAQRFMDGLIDLDELVSPDGDGE